MTGFTKNTDGSVTYRNVTVRKIGNNDWVYPTTSKYAFVHCNTRAEAFHWIDRAIARTEKAKAFLAENPTAPEKPEVVAEFEAVRDAYREATSKLNTSYGEVSRNTSVISSDWYNSDDTEVDNALEAVEIFAKQAMERAQAVIDLNRQMGEYIAAGVDQISADYRAKMWEWHESNRNLENEIVFND